MASAFYDVGVAPKALSAPRLYGALGYKSFEAMTTKELGLSAAKALQLLAIPTQLTRKRALSLGQSKSAALIELATATPEPDTAEELAKGTVVVRGPRTDTPPVRPRGEDGRTGAPAHSKWVASLYFDVHHTADDTLDKIVPAELDQVVASVAAFTWSIADGRADLGRIPEDRRGK